MGITAALLSGCRLLNGWASDPRAQLPPCVDNYCDCGDFISQPLAQEVLEAFPGDPYQLDGDGNGRACEQLPATAPTLDSETYFSNNPHLTLGNPSHAAQQNADNYLIERPQYALAYSRDRNTLIWASWLVNRSWLGPVDRQNDFRPDGALPKGTYQVVPGDYQRSGYDRGHMVASGDRTRSPQDNSATFLMTNIFPQSADNNRGPWRELEEYCRNLVYQQGKALYIIGGLYGQRGKIDQGRITTPSRVWKVIVITDRPDITPQSLTPTTETIAVDMPNRQRLDEQWQTYITSIDRIELATGYDLLSEVPEEIQAAIEARQ